MFVYVISADEKTHKIGMAVDPVARLKLLQTGQPNRLRLVFFHEVADAKRVERHAHDIVRRQHLTGEWFAVDQTVAVAAVMDAVECPPLCLRPRLVLPIWGCGNEPR